MTVVLQGDLKGIVDPECNFIRSDTTANRPGSEFKNKCGDSPMLLSGEFLHGRLTTGSIQSHANPNIFKEKITRSTRDPVPTRQEKCRISGDKAPTGQANERTTPEAV
ncbi:MAG: hypothetical protein V7K46_16320 [Nostoc sp.]